MDFSKLPKLSQTPAPPDQAEAASPVTSDGEEATADDPQVELFCQCGAPIAGGTNFCSNCGASYREVTRGRGARGAGGPEPMWVEAFLSIAVGLFLILMSARGIQYIKATLTGAHFMPYPHPTQQGVFVDYEQFENTQTGAITQYKYVDRFEHFWSDMSVTLFALALILEGIVLALVRNRWVVLLAALMIVGVTLLNLWYVIASYTRVSPITQQPYGLAPMSAIAVIFGVVMAGYQFLVFAELRRQK